MGDPEIECPDCNGEGFIFRTLAHEPDPQEVACPACGGKGWRTMTEDEANDAAADAYSDMCEGEPPITMQERHQAAWKQKQELRR